MPRDELIARRESLLTKLQDITIFKNQARARELGSELKRVEKLLADFDVLDAIAQKRKEVAELAHSSDETLRLLAEEELIKISQEEHALYMRMSAQNEEKITRGQEVIMEIRAGAGGEEATLFARELFTMYMRFAEKNNFKTVLLNDSQSEHGGYKEVVFEVSGPRAYQRLRFESGVHRVQRIPETEKMGRVHTSTASVAVLPKAREVDIEIKPQDIKIEFFRSSGPGGQNVNKVETAVRIYHLPTGLIITSQESRSQQKNRETALSLLRTKLLDARSQQEQNKTAAARRAQIGTADRSEKIRTYNFPQDRVTDHRIKQSWHNIASIMEGNIEEIVGTLGNLK